MTFETKVARRVARRFEGCNDRSDLSVSKAPPSAGLSPFPGVNVVLILLVIGVILLVASAFSVTIGRFQPGWLALAIALAVLAVWPAAH